MYWLSAAYSRNLIDCPRDRVELQALDATEAIKLSRELSRDYSIVSVKDKHARTISFFELIKLSYSEKRESNNKTGGNDH